MLVSDGVGLSCFPDIGIKTARLAEAAACIQPDCFFIRAGHRKTDALGASPPQRRDRLAQQFISESSASGVRRDTYLGDVPDVFRNETRKRDSRHHAGTHMKCD